MKYPNNKLLLRIGQADAYAAATEYIKSPSDDDVHFEALKFERYCKHPRHNLAAGSYTDDTQMSVAIAEVMVSGGEFSALTIANSFVDCFKRDWRDGYARGFQKFLEEVKDGQEFLDKIKPTSEKNGAAMRAVPIGLFSDIDMVRHWAEKQAQITHNTAIGIYGSVATALMSHYAHHTDRPMSEMPQWLYENLPSELRDYCPWSASGYVSYDNKRVTTTIRTIHMALDTLISCSSLLEVLRRIIVVGGDTDSVAAIAFSIASTRCKDELPEFFEYQLEVGRPYGVEFLKSLGFNLMDKYRQ